MMPWALIEVEAWYQIPPVFGWGVPCDRLRPWWSGQNNL
jgi:hypothetical protein